MNLTYLLVSPFANLLSMQKVSAMKKGRPLGSKTFDPVGAIAFGEVVKSFRLKEGLSQEELGHIAIIERSLKRVALTGQKEI